MVDLLYLGEWRCLCDDGTSLRTAHVVCRMLGFAKATAYKTGSDNFGRNDGKFWMDTLR